MAVTGWLTPSTATGTGWTNPSFATARDGAETNTAAINALECSGYDFAGAGISDGDTIDGIEMRINRRGTNFFNVIFTFDLAVYINNTGQGSSFNKAIAGNWTNVQTDITYGGAADVWGWTNPTGADLTDASFKTQLQTNSSANASAYVDVVELRITYTASGGPGEVSFAGEINAQSSITATLNQPNVQMSSAVNAVSTIQGNIELPFESTVRVQRYQWDDVSATTTVKTIDTAVNTSKAYVKILSNTLTSAGDANDNTILDDVEDVAITAELTSSNQITITKQANHDSSNLLVSVEVIEYVGSDNDRHAWKIIDQGTTTAPTSATTHNITISGVTNPDKVVPLVVGQRPTTINSNYANIRYSAKLTSSTNVQFAKITSTNETVIQYVIVEYVGSAWDVLHAEINDFNGDFTQSAPLYTDYAMTTTGSVTSWDEAFIESSFGGNSSTAIADVSYECLYNASSTSSVIMSLNSLSKDNVIVTAHVVNSADLTTQHGFLNVSVSSTGTDITLATTLNGDLSQHSVIATYDERDSGTDLPTGVVNYYLKDNNTINAYASRNSSSAFRYHTITWPAIEAPFEGRVNAKATVTGAIDGIPTRFAGETDATSTVSADLTVEEGFEELNGVINATSNVTAVINPVRNFATTVNATSTSSATTLETVDNLTPWQTATSITSYNIEGNTWTNLDNARILDGNTTSNTMGDDASSDYLVLYFDPVTFPTRAGDLINHYVEVTARGESGTFTFDTREIVVLNNAETVQDSFFDDSTVKTLQDNSFEDNVFTVTPSNVTKSEIETNGLVVYVFVGRTPSGGSQTIGIDAVRYRAEFVEEVRFEVQVDGTSNTVAPIAIEKTYNTQADALSTTIAQLDSAPTFATQIDATSTIVGDILSGSNLFGEINATATVTPKLFKDFNVAGEINATATVTPNLSVETTFATQVDGLSTTTTALSKDIDIFATTNAVSTSQANTIVRDFDISSHINTTSTVDGDFDVSFTRELAGEIDTSATVTANLIADNDFNGEVICLSSVVTPGFNIQNAISAQVVNTSTITGGIIVHQTHLLGSQIDAISTTTGNKLNKNFDISSQIDATSTVNGNFGKDVNYITNVDSTSSINIDKLYKDFDYAVTVDALSTTNAASENIITRGFASNVNATSTTTTNIIIDKTFNIIVDATSTTTNTIVQVIRGYTAQIQAQSTFEGRYNLALVLAQEINAQSNVVVTLSSEQTLGLIQITVAELDYDIDANGNILFVSKEETKDVQFIDRNTVTIPEAEQTTIIL